MKTDYKKLIQQAKEIDEKATPGPWMWDMNENNQQCLLTTTHSGKYSVMGFQRYGMQSALPSFQVYDHYDGPMKKRGSHGMIRADQLSKSYPGQEHHHGFDNYIDHPDARYIAESRALFHDMIVAINDLLSRAETAETERDKARRDRAAVEAILGDNYDLERLHELIEADRQGKCVIIPVKPGEKVVQESCPDAKGETVDCITIYPDGRITYGFHIVGFRNMWVDHWEDGEACAYTPCQSTGAAKTCRTCKWWDDNSICKNDKGKVFQTGENNTCPFWEE